jgi:pectin methylesterase-like acyl-CoA thioesterase
MSVLIFSFFNQTNSSSISTPNISTSNVETQTQTLLSSELTSALVTPTSPPEGSIIVPDDFVTINQAVPNASDGGIIFVRAGQYNESVTIDKSIWLIA